MLCYELSIVFYAIFYPLRHVVIYRIFNDGGIINFFQSVKLAFSGSVLANCPHCSMAVVVLSMVIFVLFLQRCNRGE